MAVQVAAHGEFTVVERHRTAITQYNSGTYWNYRPWKSQCRIWQGTNINDIPGVILQHIFHTRKNAAIWISYSDDYDVSHISPYFVSSFRSRLRVKMSIP